MKILQVTDFFKPSWESGGPARVAYEISKKLIKRGHEVTVYTTDGFKSRLDIEKNVPVDVDGIKTYYFRNLSSYLTREIVLPIPYYLPIVARKELRNFDIIHIHEHRTLIAAIVHHYAKKNSIPYILQAHGSVVSTFQKQMLKKIFDIFFGYWILNDASKVIALTKTEVRQYKKMRVDEDKIEIIPNGIDLLEYTDLPPKGSLKKKFNIEEDEKIILYVGRIHKMKGIDFLIKAYAYLVENSNFNGAMLVIAGPDDGYLGEARHLVNHLKIADKVMFTGMLSEKEKISAYVDSSIVVNVEPRNVFGLVPLEAAACSTPVIVSKTNAITEMVGEGKFGFSVNYSDIAGLAETMEKMLNNDDLVKRMGENGRKYVFENFNWSNIVTKLEKVYKETVVCARIP